MNTSLIILLLGVDKHVVVDVGLVCVTGHGRPMCISTNLYDTKFSSITAR